jgi:iron complex outermembrane receptor protein
MFSNGLNRGAVRAYTRSLICWAAAGVSGLGAIAQAQDQQALDEIVVTAQKREQNVQDVGIAISAFSGRQLQELGLIESTDIAALTTGVSVSASAGDQSRQFSIRGVTQNDFADHTEAPNAVYIDEGYIAAPQGQVFALFDIERVEVLKGPQGTLFGRNATGGLVHYISRRPTREVESFADLTYGSYDHVRLEGALGGPFSESLSGRLSVLYNRHDEIIENRYPQGNMVNALTGAPFVGSPSGAEDFWNDNQWAVRGQLLWEGETVETHLSVFAARQNVSVGPQQSRPVTAILNAAGSQIDTIFAEQDPQACEALSAVTGGCLPISFLDGEIPGVNEDSVRPVVGGDLFGYRDADGSDFDASADHALDDFNEYNVRGVTANVEWGLGDMTLHSVSHYAFFDKLQTLDVDSAPEPQSLVLQEAEHDTFTQEFRMTGGSDRLRWVAGVYYLLIDVEYAQGLAFSPDSPISILFFGGMPAESPIFVDMKTDSYSAFGQLDFDLTDSVTLVAGLRGIREEKDYLYDNFWFASIRDETIDDDQTPLPIPVSPDGGGLAYPSFTGATSDTFWAGKLQLEYRFTDDLLLYGGVNRGVKAGGFNAKLNDFAPAVPDAEIPYGEETLTAYEAGFKSTVADGRTRINGSAFYYDYQDYQAFVFARTSGIIRNADATVKGAELEVASRPVDGLDLMLAASWLDAVVEDLAIAPGVLRDVVPTFTPEWHFGALLRYEWPAQALGGLLSVQLDGSYVSSRFHNLRNFSADEMDGYTLGNAQVSWQSESGRWQTSLFVDNFTDERYKVSGFDLATLCGCNEEAYGKPRWYGVRVRYSVE